MSVGLEFTQTGRLTTRLVSMAGGSRGSDSRRQFHKAADGTRRCKPDVLRRRGPLLRWTSPCASPDSWGRPLAFVSLLPAAAVVTRVVTVPGDAGSHPESAGPQPGRTDTDRTFRLVGCCSRLNNGVPQVQSSRALTCGICQLPSCKRPTAVGASVPTAATPPREAGHEH